jgi:hypothetical protein
MFKLARLALVACLAVAVTGAALAYPGGPKLDSFASTCDTVSVKPPFDVHKPKLTQITFDASGITFAIASDGVKGIGAFSFGLVNNFTPKVSLNTMTAATLGGGNLYQGLNLSYRFYDRKGASANVFGGWKGIQLTGQVGVNYSHPWVLGVGATIPFSTH